MQTKPLVISTCVRGIIDSMVVSGLDRVHSQAVVSLVTQSCQDLRSLDARRKVILLHSSGFSVRKITTHLSEENVVITQQSLYPLINNFQQTIDVYINMKISDI